MDINEIASLSADQDRGKWFELADPVTGAGTGIRLKVVGPDSDTARRNRLLLADEIADLMADDGRVTAEARERARIASLARHVIDWEAREDGAPVPFSHANVVRLLKAGVWVQAQVDAWAADRAAHRVA